jgi:hypothetical protein
MHVKIVNTFGKNYRILFIAFTYMTAIQKTKTIFVGSEVLSGCGAGA